MSEILKLKRFSEDKHEQIEQLIVWCQMMGLTGRDLVSIGGKLDRMNSPETRMRDRLKEYRAKYQYTLGGTNYDPVATFVLDGVTFVAENNKRQRQISKWRVYPKGDANLVRVHGVDLEHTADTKEMFPFTWSTSRCALYNLLTDIELGQFRPQMRKTAQK
jgi:hypothetical protein